MMTPVRREVTEVAEVLNSLDMVWTSCISATVETNGARNNAILMITWIYRGDINTVVKGLFVDTSKCAFLLVPVIK